MAGLRKVDTLLYNDRRRARRLQTRLRVDYCPMLLREDGVRAAGFRRAIADDLSATGTFLGDTSYLQVGSIVQLLLRLPDVAANPINCFARVVRKDLVGRQGYGLRFLRLRGADARRLEGFVQERNAADARALTA